MLTIPSCGPVPACVCVCGASVQGLPTPLDVATLAGNSNGNMCTTTTHKYTHTQTNKYCVLGPLFGLSLFSGTSPSFIPFQPLCHLSLCPLIQSVVNVVLTDEISS